MNPRPILVTGSHRSGTTWVGRMLAAADDVGYVHEPFNLDLRFGVGPQVAHWYQYIDAANARQFDNDIRRLLAGRYPLTRNLRKTRSVRDLVQIVRHRNELRRFARHRCRLLVKDPLAFFSAGWLADQYGFEVVVMIRHPAAFCSSLKLKNWRFDFSHLAAQTRLVDRYLAGFADRIRAHAASSPGLIDEAILLWNCIHHVADQYRRERPGWLYARHEDLSLDPVREFRALYEALGLKFTPDVATVIEGSSGAHNPAEQLEGDEFLRDSRANISNWKRRLSGDEIDRVRRGTAAVWPLFYEASDW